jgi:hypothetical protein
MTTAPLDNKQLLVVRSEKLPAKPKPFPWKAFKQFADDCDELLEYYEAACRGRDSPQTADRTSGDVEDDAEWLQRLIARCETGFAQFDREDKYHVAEDGERTLKQSHIAQRLGVLLGSFPNTNPHAPEVYSKMLVEHVGAIKGVNYLALESACRAIAESEKFAPAIAEMVKLLRTHIRQWCERRWALQAVERMRHELIAALQEHEQEKKDEEHERQIETAVNRATIAMRTTQGLAKEIETKKLDLVKLVQRHAEAEQRESEAMRALRKLTMTPEEVETEAIEAAAKSNGSGQHRLM